MVHINSGYLAVLIGGVVVNSFVRVAAGGVDCDFVFSLAHVDAAALLGDGAEDVEKLADAGGFGVAGEGIELRERRFYKAGGGGKVPRKPHCAHAPAVGFELHLVGKAVDRRFGGKAHIVAEVGHMVVKGGVVGEDPDGVVVNLEPVLDGLNGDGFLPVGNYPVKGREGKLRGKANIHEVYSFEKHPRFGNVGALSQNPGNKLKGGHVVLALGFGLIVRVAREVEPSHRKPLFVGGFVVERVAVHNGGHSYHGVVLFEGGDFFEVQNEISRGNGDALVIGILEVEVPPEIVVLGFIGRCGAHFIFSFFVLRL